MHPHSDCCIGRISVVPRLWCHSPTEDPTPIRDARTLSWSLLISNWHRQAPNYSSQRIDQIFPMPYSTSLSIFNAAPKPEMPTQCGRARPLGAHLLRLAAAPVRPCQVAGHRRGTLREARRGASSLTSQGCTLFTGDHHGVFLFRAAAYAAVLLWTSGRAGQGLSPRWGVSSCCTKRCKSGFY